MGGVTGHNRGNLKELAHSIKPEHLVHRPTQVCQCRPSRPAVPYGSKVLFHSQVLM